MRALSASQVLSPLVISYRLNVDFIYCIEGVRECFARELYIGFFMMICWVFLEAEIGFEINLVGRLLGGGSFSD
jgi:hypothetical protein